MVGTLFAKPCKMRLPAFSILVPGITGTIAWSFCLFHLYQSAQFRREAAAGWLAAPTAPLLACVFPITRPLRSLRRDCHRFAYWRQTFFIAPPTASARTRLCQRDDPNVAKTLSFYRAACTQLLSAESSKPLLSLFQRCSHRAFVLPSATTPHAPLRPFIPTSARSLRHA